MNNAPGARPLGRVSAFLDRTEDAIAGAALVLMAALPAVEILLRNVFDVGIPGTVGYVQNLTLWVGFMGAVVATRLGRHISLSAGLFPLPERVKRYADGSAAFASTAVASGLAWGSLEFIRLEMESPVLIGAWLPTWVAAAVLPLSFVLVGLRYVVDQSGWRMRTVAAAGILGAVVLGILPQPIAEALTWPLIAALLVVGLVGAPIFVVIAGAALLLFVGDDIPVAAIPVETYRLVVSPTIPTIPLFALAGYVLAEGGASGRLVQLFRALFAWMPGGMAVAAILVCAFFSTFTGASGITIVALGGLLLPVLLKNGYPERFSLGLLTSTGSIGLLFPPSLAVILYGVVAHVPIPDMFIAGILPGLILIVAVCAYAVVTVRSAEGERPKFGRREALSAVWTAKWEVLLPVVAIGGIFGGMTTLTEAAALTALYAIFIEVVVHRDLSPTGGLPGAILKCVTLIGGVLIILGVAMGLTNYLVDAEVPARAAAWVKANIESRIVFLLALNVFLLIVGCLMDVFSAIVVVVPLILPISQAFGVPPLHLGIIFLVNLELGYLTPPVGMNLFLASYRFNRSLREVGRRVLPFLAVMLGVLLLVTYVPSLTLVFAGGE